MFSGSRWSCEGAATCKSDWEKASITTNECPCNQHHLRWLGPHTQRIPHAQRRRRVQPSASDCPMHRFTAKWANQPSCASTIRPPRATLTAPVLQPPRTNLIYRHSAKSERMQLAKCSLWQAHSAMRKSQQRLERQARPWLRCLLIQVEVECSTHLDPDASGTLHGG